MKAICVRRFGPPEVMQLEDVPDPRPGPGQALVRIHAAGVNPVDAYLRAGTYRPELPLPFTPGIDGAGVVEAAGAEVRAVKPGQRVYVTWAATGTYAEKVLCAAAHVFPLPEQTAFDQGAALGVPYGTAYRALFQRAHAIAGETVLVHGASGGVGLAAVQLARAAGLRVIGTAGSAAGLALVRQEGAHEVCSHKDPAYRERLRELTGGRGADVILEMLANVNLGHDLSLLARFGRVVIIGSRGRVELDPREAMTRDAAVLGMSLFNIAPHELASAHAALAAGLEAGTLRPVISSHRALADAPAAHHAVLESSTLGKIVLIPAAAPTGGAGVLV